MTVPHPFAGPPGAQRLAFPIAAAAVIVGLDVATKRLAESRLEAGTPHWIIDGVVGFERTWNSGVAFSMLDGRRVVWVLLFVALVGLGWITRDIVRATTTVAGLLPVAAIAGGAAGNVIDRLRDGRVTDFIVVGPWPRFNLADSSLTIGLVLLLVQAATTKGHDDDERHHDPQSG